MDYKIICEKNGERWQAYYTSSQGKTSGAVWTDHTQAETEAKGITAQWPEIKTTVLPAAHADTAVEDTFVCPSCGVAQVHTTDATDGGTQRYHCHYCPSTLMVKDTPVDLSLAGEAR